LRRHLIEKEKPTKRMNTEKKTKEMMEEDTEEEAVVVDMAEIEINLLPKKMMVDTSVVNSARRSQEVNLKEVTTTSKTASKLHTPSPQEAVAKLREEPTSKPKGVERLL
jgi:hypothetical protein